MCKYVIYLIGVFAMTTVMIMIIIVPTIRTMIMTITKIALNDNDRTSMIEVAIIQNLNMWYK